MTTDKKSAFIYSPRFAEYNLGEHHPFKSTRSKVVYDLCNKLGLFDRPSIRVVKPEPLDDDTMALFHDRDYLDALHQANDGLFRDPMISFNIGTGECPVFEGIYDYCALAAGGNAPRDAHDL